MSRRMNPVVKAGWVGALRSKNHQQGRLALRDQDGRMCCLGVLCQEHSEATGTPWGEFETESGSCGIAYMGRVTHPPQAVLDWAGLDWFSLSVTVAGRRVSLSDLNDGWVHNTRFTFDAIADLVEAQF